MKKWRARRNSDFPLPRVTMPRELVFLAGRAFLATALVLAVSGCEVAPAEPGSLAITVTGLAQGANAAITVDGPNGFTTQVAQSSTLSGLVPGTYTVGSAAVTVNGAPVVPSAPTQTAIVKSAETASVTVAYGATALSLGVQIVASGLSSPVHLVSSPNDSRLFIVEQPGRIRIVKAGVLLPTPFLDISARVNFGGERGFLSMAFDPAYATNGRFYVYYTGANGDIFVDRHIVSANPDIAGTAFQQVITVQHRLYANHNGGLVAFGPDGMLYISIGDGGSGGDPDNNSQNINSLLGKLLRIDVSSLPYTIPPGNPFVNKDGADEIWAYGLRNPWRFAFDVHTSPAQLYIADVGQGAFEEVDVVNPSSAGLNYGWRITEGLHCYSPSSGCSLSGLTLPVLEYDHGQGCSISGGAAYRGAAIPELRGHYFYSDYCSGWLRSFRLSGTEAVDRVDWAIGSIGNVLSFGFDSDSEMYLLSANGSVYRVIKK